MRNPARINTPNKLILITGFSIVVFGLLLIIGNAWNNNIRNNQSGPFTYSLLNNSYTHVDDNMSVTLTQQNGRQITKVANKDSSISFKLESTRLKENKRVTNLLAPSQNNVITYATNENATLEYEVIKDKYSKGIKENIVLPDKNAPRKYEFSLDLENVHTYKTVGKRWHFYDKDGNDLFHIPEGVMVDASGEESRDMKIEITKNKDGKDILIVDANSKWLDDPERAYPVKVDPSVVIDPDPDEIVERSRQTNTTFVKRNEDNTMQFSATSEGAPVNFEDENGEWQPYNTTLVPSEKADYDWQLGASDHQAYFKNTLSQSPAIRIEKEGKFITLHPSELQYINENGQTQIVSAPKLTAQASVQDNVITYKDAYGSGIDLLFTIEPIEIKKEIVIHTEESLPAPTITDAYLEINLNMDTSHDLHIFTQQKGDSEETDKSEWDRNASVITQGIIEFRDTNPDQKDRNYDGEINKQDLTLLQFLPAVAYDSSEQQQFINSDEDDMILALQNKNSQSAVSVQTPYSWLENAVYPVTIDPTAGPNNPSATSQHDGCPGCNMPDWNNPSNVYTSNNVRATANMAGPAGATTSYSKVLSTTGFGFSLPTTTSAINGIQVGIERMASTANRLRFDHVRLLNGSATQNRATTTAWPTTEAYQNFGSTSDLWGGTWTRTNINSSSFGVNTQAFFYQGVSGSVTASIDHIRITVTYTANTPPSITISPSVNYGSYNRLGPNNTPVTVSFRATDAEQTSSNQLTYQIRTSSAIGGGTLVGSGNATSGVTRQHSLANTASGLINGNQTLYLRVSDGTDWSNASSFTLQRDITDPSASGVSSTPSWVPATNQYAVIFTPSDTYSTSTNELTWWIRTGSGGGGTQLATGNATSGNARNTGTITDSTLSAGNNTRYLRIRDGANNIYETSFIVQKDGTDPSPPSSLTSPSHTTSTWSNDATIQINWTAGSDAHSGLSGYSYVFDTSPSTTPDAIQDIGAVTTVTSGALSNGNSHYFHIRAIDNAGNTSSTVHIGPFYVDTSGPTGPTSVTSPSHTPGIVSNDNTIQINWTAATDSHSGLSGYAYVFDNSPSTNPTVQNLGTVTTVTSDELDDGTDIYFHIRARDNIGNWGTTTHLGPFYIDSSGPSQPGIPTTQSPTVNRTPTWTWTEPEESIAGLRETNTYRIQWSQSPTFASGVFQAFSNTTSYTHTSPLGVGTWYARIRAFDTLNGQSDYSSTGSVEIVTQRTMLEGLRLRGIQVE